MNTEEVMKDPDAMETSLDYDGGKRYGSDPDYLPMLVIKPLGLADGLDVKSEENDWRCSWVSSMS